MSKLQAVERITLGEQVAAQLAAMIEQGRWQPGVKLPAEAELCATLNVGRSTLREALKSLAFVGLVRMRAGDGTYVAERTCGLLDRRVLTRSLLTEEKDWADVYETRMIVEIESAGFAAERATPEGIARLQQLVEQGEVRLRAKEGKYSELDLQFHLAVADCSQNKWFVLLLRDLQELMLKWISKSQELPGTLENAQHQHQRICESIAARDAGSARKLMRIHLQTFHSACNLLYRISRAGEVEGRDAERAAAGSSAKLQAGLYPKEIT